MNKTKIKDLIKDLASLLGCKKKANAVPYRLRRRAGTSPALTSVRQAGNFQIKQVTTYKWWGFVNGNRI